MHLIHFGHRRQEASTLLEVLIAVAIITTGLGGLAGLATRAIEDSARSQRVFKTVVLAENELAYWSAQGGGKALQLGEGVHPFSNPATKLPENGGAETQLTVKQVEPGLVELTAVAGLPVSPTHPTTATLTTWLRVEPAQ